MGFVRDCGWRVRHCQSKVYWAQHSVLPSLRPGLFRDKCTNHEAAVPPTQRVYTELCLGSIVSVLAFRLWSFLTFALCILSAHNLWCHLAHSRAHAHWKHGGFALTLSSFSWKMAKAHLLYMHEHGHPNFLSSHCNQLIINFALGKTIYLISIAENWINNKNRR